MRTRIWLSACLAAVLSTPAAADERPTLLIDADTANEIDDCYAIARLVAQSEFRVVGLNSTQWRHYLSGRTLRENETTVAASQRVNEGLLRVLGFTGLPANVGSAEPMGKPWGGFEPKNSAAARAIIRHALETAPGEKLTVACLGATTNMATALALRPEIAERVRLYLLGFRVDTDSGVWNKSSFNVRRDLNAADYVLNAEGLETHIMPANVAQPLQFQKPDAFARQERLGPLGDFLSGVWMEHCPDHTTRIMWDLALAEAIVRPELATEVTLSTPPENVRREVSVYASIDERAMASDFWESVTRFVDRQEAPGGSR